MTLTLLEMTLLVILVLVLLAPLESPEWWVRRYPTPSLPTPESEPATDIRRFAVYLLGTAILNDNSMLRREHAILEEVRKQLLDVIVTEDMLPYAMENRGLPQRATAWLWRCLGWA